MAQLIDLSLIPALDGDGNPVSGAELRFYRTGTLTPVSVYTTAALTTAHATPVVSDADGRFPAIYVADTTELRARLTQAGTLIRDIDPINPFADTGSGTFRLSQYTTLAAAMEAAAGKRLLIDVDMDVSAGVPVEEGTTIVGSGGILTATTNAMNLLTVEANDVVIDGVVMRGPDLGESMADVQQGFAVYLRDCANVVIRDCDIRFFGQGGIYLRRSCYDIEISGNLIAECKWNIPGGAGDINSYGESGLGSRRVYITNNRCYSNTSAGINVNVLGQDADFYITGNDCRPMDTTDFTEITGRDVMRRHAIAANYVGVSSPLGRIVVRGNYLANSRWTGVYDQASAFGRNDIVIAENVIVACGQSADLGPDPFPTNFGYPGGQYNVAGGIQGGVFSQVTGGQSIYENTFINCPLGMNLQFPASGLRSVTVRGNSFTASTIAMRIAGLPLACVVNGNQFTASTGVDIDIGLTGGSSGIGGIDIRNNSFQRTVEGYCVSGDTSNGTLQNYIVENSFVGPGASAADGNTAIHWRFPTVTVVNNRFRGFKRAFNLYSYLANSTRYAGPLRFDMNEVDTCTTAFGGGAVTTNNTLMPLVENILLGGTALADGGSLGSTVSGLSVVRIGSLYETADTAAPTTRYWGVGDRVRNSTPAVGQPKAWVCTVAGNPGTFVSEGNL